MAEDASDHILRRCRIFIVWYLRHLWAHVTVLHQIGSENLPTSIVACQRTSHHTKLRLLYFHLHLKMRCKNQITTATLSFFNGAVRVSPYPPHRIILVSLMHGKEEHTALGRLSRKIVVRHHRARYKLNCRRNWYRIRGNTRHSVDF